MKQFNNTELIQRFFKGELNTEEKEQFSKALKKNTALAEEFAFTKALKYAFLMEEEAASKKRIEEYYTSRELEVKKKSSYKNIWIIVFGLSVLTGIVAWKTGKFGEPTLTSEPVERPIDLSFVEYIPINFAVSDDVQQAYDDGDFATANDGFQSVDGVDVDFFPAMLFSGVCYVYLQKEQKAIDVLSKIDVTIFPEIKAEVSLYLGIAYYQLGQKDKAAAAWEDLQETNKQIVIDIKAVIDEQIRGFNFE